MPAQLLLPRCLLAGPPLCSLFPSSANSTTSCTVPKLGPNHLPTRHPQSNSGCQFSLLNPAPAPPLRLPSPQPSLSVPITALASQLVSLVLSPHPSPCLSMPPASSAFIKVILQLKSLCTSSHKIATLFPPPGTAFPLSAEHSHFQCSQMPSFREASDLSPGS